MIEVDIDYLSAGDVLAKSHIFKSYDQGSTNIVDLSKGFRLTDAVIRKLKEHYGARSLFIEDKNLGVDYDSAEIALEEKQRIVTKIKSNMESVIANGTLDIKGLEKSVKTIIDQVFELLSGKDKLFTSLSNLFIKSDGHDSYTFEHSVNVSIYALIIAFQMEDTIKNFRQHIMGMKGLDKYTIQEIIAMNMILHDLGKLKIAPEILNLPGKLSERQFNLIKNHPTYGWKIWKEINDKNRSEGKDHIPATFMVSCLYHHQSFDGITGYPFFKMKGEERLMRGREIPFLGRICSVADIYDAITSNRPYRKKMHPLKAIRILKEEKNNKLDPEMVDAFIPRINVFPIGKTVRLSNDDLGLVVGYHQDNKLNPILRPYMRRVQDKDGSWKTIKLSGNQTFDLMNSNLNIIIDGDEITHRDIRDVSLL